MLTIRLEATLKERLERAASARGQSLSAFVVEAATGLAARTRPDELAVTRAGTRERGSVPPFFRALCETAAAGGGHNYESVGFRFAGSLDNMGPGDEREWRVHTRALRQLCKQEDAHGIVQWCVATFPDAIRLVPARRRDSFARGVIRRWHEYDTDWATSKS